jgi:hypothetical protein
LNGPIIIDEKNLFQAFSSGREGPRKAWRFVQMRIGNLRVSIGAFEGIFPTKPIG